MKTEALFRVSAALPCQLVSFCFRKRFCAEICCNLILGFSNNKICLNCTEYTLQSCKMRNHCIDLKICERTEIIACAELHVVNTGIVIDVLLNLLVT